MDDEILALYAKGMSTREIVDTFKEMYGADVSPEAKKAEQDKAWEKKKKQLKLQKKQKQ